MNLYAIADNFRAPSDPKAALLALDVWLRNQERKPVQARTMPPDAPGFSRKSGPWSVADQQNLARWYSSGVPMTVIQDRLNRPASGIAHKVYEMGLHRPWRKP